MDATIKIKHIIALNECVADHVTQPGTLYDNDTSFEQFVSSNTPKDVLDHMRVLAEQFNMNIAIFYHTRKKTLAITTWYKDSPKTDS